MTRRILAVFLAVAMLSPSTALAIKREVKGLDPLPPGHLYRFHNEEGSTVFSRTLTVDGVNGGYAVLDRYGRVLLSVRGRVASAEQDKRNRRKAVVQQVSEEQARKDRDILRLYSTADAAENAMERQLTSVRASLDYALISLSKTKKSRDNEKKKFQDYERRGEPIPSSVLNALGVYEERLIRLASELESYEREMANIRTVFTPMIERLVEIEAAKENEN